MRLKKKRWAHFWRRWSVFWSSLTIVSFLSDPWAWQMKKNGEFPLLSKKRMRCQEGRLYYLTLSSCAGLWPECNIVGLLLFRINRSLKRYNVNMLQTFVLCCLPAAPPSSLFSSLLLFHWRASLSLQCLSLPCLHKMCFIYTNIRKLNNKSSLYWSFFLKKSNNVSTSSFVANLFLQRWPSTWSTLALKAGLWTARSPEEASSRGPRLACTDCSIPKNILEIVLNYLLHLRFFYSLPPSLHPFRIGRKSLQRVNLEECFPAFPVGLQAIVCIPLTPTSTSFVSRSLSCYWMAMFSLFTH